MAEDSYTTLKEKNKTMSRWFLSNTTEITNHNDTVLKWCLTNSTMCYKVDTRSANIIEPSPISVLDTNDIDIYWWHIRIDTMIIAGYGISIVCVSIAILIFLLFSQLQNARVRIHMNLFAGMALQNVMWLSQGVFYGNRMFLSMITQDMRSGHLASIPCRTMMVIGNYFKLSCFAWVLMESWYFYNFICRAPYNEIITIKPLMLFAWGMPGVIIIPYVIVHLLTTETNFCWVDVDTKINILAVPIFMMILINLCFFILNVRVIFIKLNCSVLHRRQKHFWKWFKSTLTLVPLFGAYDVFFGVEPWIENKHAKIYFYNILRICCGLHGFIIATLYCFMNKEVQSEIKRNWKNWKSQREIDYNFVKKKRSSSHDEKKLEHRNSESYFISSDVV